MMRPYLSRVIFIIHYEYRSAIFWLALFVFSIQDNNPLLFRKTLLFVTDASFEV